MKPAEQRRVLVLGTGTGIGKTFATRRLVELFPDSVGVKPIESGATPAQLGAGRGGDGAAIDLGRLRHSPPPFLFEEPISPHLAAAKLGRRIDLTIVSAWLDDLRLVEGGVPPTVFVESAGGAFSPLGPGLFNADLVRSGEFDRVVLVAPNRLGVLHDVVATLMALQAHSDCTPDVVLLNDASPHDEGDLARALNPSAVRDEVARLAASVRVFELGWGAPLPAGVVDALALRTRPK